jgi:hypothetical protein
VVEKEKPKPALELPKPEPKPTWKPEVTPKAPVEKPKPEPTAREPEEEGVGLFRKVTAAFQRAIGTGKEDNE